MAVEKYSIGGTVVETETSEAFADIPQNTTLLAQKLTANAPVKPEIVKNLTSVDQVFGYYKPHIEVDFETEEGTTRKETLRFSSVGDFGIRGITPQSRLLNELTLKREQYRKFIKQLKTNKLLKQALADQTNKETLLSALRALVRELEAAK